MNKTMRIKLIIDNSMTVLMLFAMAYQLTGNMAHEVIGATIFILFFVHNFLNRCWYKSLLKGRYNVRRIIIIRILKKQIPQRRVAHVPYETKRLQYVG